MTNNWWEDSFEKMERGTASAQKTGQSNQAKPVLKKIQEMSGVGVDGQTAEQLAVPQQNFTPIDTGKLGSTYKQQDNPELTRIREKLHYLRLQQSETLKAIEERKQEEIERRRGIEDEEEQKRLTASQSGLKSVEAPHGKEKKSIFGGKKTKKTKVNLENKPGGGKQ